MTSDNPLSHVSDTARWVAFYRAMESERPDALFRDPHARRLAGPEGEAVVRGMKKGRQYAWPMIVRTAVMDEIILRTVERDGADAVVNLGAGLDARAYRLDLPGDFRWIDVDLPGILQVRAERLGDATAVCRADTVQADLTDPTVRRTVLERVATTGDRLLVLTEGLLVYLQPEQVAALARDLHQHASLRWWLIDLGSPRLLKMLARTWGRQLTAAGAPMIFAPAEGTAFFEPHGWKEVEFRPIFDESIRLGRTVRFARFWRWLGRFYPESKREEFRRMSGVVLLERT